jgi:hypothetical protein
MQNKRKDLRNEVLTILRWISECEKIETSTIGSKDASGSPNMKGTIITSKTIEVIQFLFSESDAKDFLITLSNT